MTKWDIQDIKKLVEMLIKYNHKYYCSIHGMDQDYMYPDEIIGEFENYLKWPPQHIFAVLKRLTIELDAISVGKKPTRLVKKPR